MKTRGIEIFQYVSIAFTVIVLCSGLIAIAQYGTDAMMGDMYLIQMFLLLVLCWGIQLVMEKITCLERLGYKGWTVLSIVLEFAAYQIMAIFCNWYTVKAENIIFYGVIFFVLEAFIRRIYYKKWKAEEESLNELIQEKIEKR